MELTEWMAFYSWRINQTPDPESKPKPKPPETGKILQAMFSHKLKKKN